MRYERDNSSLGLNFFVRTVTMLETGNLDMLWCDHTPVFGFELMLLEYYV
jgi:hypothetical protein